MAIYYVSPTGSDAANGTSAGTPWLTVAKVNGSSFSPGDSIFFKRGGMWRELLTVPSSGSAGNPITFGAYDTGNEPILNAADLKTWTQGTGGGSEETGGIFASGFESNDFTAWTSISNFGSTAIATSPTQVNGGTYAMRVTGDASDERVHANKTLASEMASGDTFYFRFYMYAATGSLEASSFIRPLRGLDGATARMYVQLRTSAAGDIDAITVFGAAVIINTVAVSNFTMGAWNYIEIAFKVHATVGGAQAWVNGTNISSNFAVNTSVAIGLDTIWIGNDAFSDGLVNGQHVYFDDVKVDTSPIGAFSSGGVPTTVWYTALAYDPFALVVAGTYGAPVGSIVAVVSDGDWFWDDPTNTLYVYAVSDPASTVEVPTRFFSIVSQSTARHYITVRDLELRYGLYYNFKDSAGDHWMIDNVTAEGAGHGGLVFENNTDITVINSTISYSNQIGAAGIAEALSLNNVTTLLLDGNTLHHNGEEGIVIKYGSTDGVVSNNLLYENGTLRDSPQIYLDGVSDITVEYNITRDGTHSGIGIAVEDHVGENPTSDIRVRYNLMYRNAGAGIMIYFEAPGEAFSVLSADIDNNVVYGNGHGTAWGGLYDFNSGATTANYGTVRLRNNLFFNNTSLGGSKEIRDDSAAMGNWLIDHNLFKAGAPNDRSGTNSITTTDPLVVDGVNGNFMLQAGSPAIDAGTDIGLPYAGEAPDIGVFEFNDPAFQLSVSVVIGYGRHQIMPLPAFLFPASGVLLEGERLLEVLTVRRGLTAVLAEALLLRANTVTAIRGNTGQVAFNASPDHAEVTNYTARVRVSGNSTVVATQDLGVPTPDGNNVIVVNLAATFAGLGAGNYTVSILTTSAGGSTDSTESSAFALPLT